MKKKVQKSDSIWVINDDLPDKRHEAGSDRYIIVDGMNLAHAAYHAYSRLSNKGKSVAVLFGFPNMLKSLMLKNNFRPDKTIIAWDGLRSKIRMGIWQNYKSHRDDKDPSIKIDIERQVKLLRKLLYYMGICQAHDLDLEGDDMVYFLTKKYQMLGKVYIVSGDKDMLQLVNRDVTVYNPRTDELFTPEHVTIKTGVKVTQFLDYMYLVGDTSDDIPGVRGIGEVRASKFLNFYGSIKNYLKDKDAEFTGMMDKEKVAKIAKRNRKLMDLKYYCEKYFPDYKIKYYKDREFPRLRLNKFIRMCREFKMGSLTQPMFTSWVKSLHNEK